MTAADSSLPEPRRAKSNRENHEEHRDPAENDVEGIAPRLAAGGEHLARVHRSKRPQERKRCVGEDEAANDAQSAVSTG